MDEVQEWLEAHRRVVELVSGKPAEATERRVPACPDWTVRDLFSHMVGLGADVLAGDEPDDHNEAWTANQVERRRGRSVAELVEEWAAVAGPLCDRMRAHGTRPLSDVIIHEQDLRGALGEPGGRDSAGIAIVRDRVIARFAARIADLPPIALVGEGWRWASAGAVEDAPVAVHASDFDLARALVTRRSAAQLTGWTVRGDLTPYLVGFAWLGELPSVDLTD